MNQYNDKRLDRYIDSWIDGWVNKRRLDGQMVDGNVKYWMEI